MKVTKVPIARDRAPFPLRTFASSVVKKSPLSQRLIPLLTALLLVTTLVELATHADMSLDTVAKAVNRMRTRLTQERSLRIEVRTNRTRVE